MSSPKRSSSDDDEVSTPKRLATVTLDPHCSFKTFSVSPTHRAYVETQIVRVKETIVIRPSTHAVPHIGRSIVLLRFKGDGSMSSLNITVADNSLSLEEFRAMARLPNIFSIDDLSAMNKAGDILAIELFWFTNSEMRDKKGDLVPHEVRGVRRLGLFHLFGFERNKAMDVVHYADRSVLKTSVYIS